MAGATEIGLGELIMGAEKETHGAISFCFLRPETFFRGTASVAPVFTGLRRLSSVAICGRSVKDGFLSLRKRT